MNNKFKDYKDYKDKHKSISQTDTNQIYNLELLHMRQISEIYN
jgi:hypothetical protein